jgi:hypothetical protein
MSAGRLFIPPHSARLLASIPRTISNERLVRYLAATGHDLSQALTLYEHNVHLSEALYGLLHGIEIAVRNSIHAALCMSYRQSNWYDLAPLAPYWQRELQRAKTNAGPAAPAGKIIAELTFGFWVELLKQHNHRSLWVGMKLHRAFPNARGMTRGHIHDRLKIAQRLRNRISHHERILTSANTLYAGFDCLTLAELIQIAEWVCPETAHWIRTRFRYADAHRTLTTVHGLGFRL